MDELRRNKELVERIRKQCEAIKLKAAADKEKTAKAKEDAERRAREKALAAAPGVEFMDLPEHVLHLVVNRCEHQELCTLAATCGTLNAMIRDASNLWERMCRTEYGVREPAAKHIPRMDTGILGRFNINLLEGPASRSFGRAAPHRSTSSTLPAARSLQGMRARASTGMLRSSAPMSLSSSQGSCTAAWLRPYPLKGTPWRAVYRDRHRGWRMICTVLQWLRSHSSPNEVSGREHKFQLCCALEYMQLFTALGGSCAAGRRLKAYILAHEGLQSCIALLDNPIWQVQQLALSVIANMMVGDGEVQTATSCESISGKRIAESLVNQQCRVVQQASRALANMWASFPIPQVMSHEKSTSHACERYGGSDHVMYIQEYSSKGETYGLYSVVLSVDAHTGELLGTGRETLADGEDAEDEEFDIYGQVRTHESGAEVWEFHKLYANEFIVTYNGYGDEHGCYGIYSNKRVAGSAQSFIISKEMAPRVFRLISESSLGSYDPGTRKGD